MQKRILYHAFSLFILFLIVLIPQSCSVSAGQHFLGSNQAGGVLNDIVKRGKLVALTDDNPFNYFEFNGEPKGYQYEMLKKFADHLNVDLEIIVEPDYHKALQYLQQRRVDLVAMELPPVIDSRYAVEQSEPLYTARQVLVQRKPANWKSIATPETLDSKLVKNISQLKGQTISISALSRKQYYLTDLQHETRQDIFVKTVSGKTAADLFRDVEDGRTKFTVAFESTAKAYAMIYRDLDVNTAVSSSIGVAWTLRKGSVNLREAANKWIRDNRDSRNFKYTYSRYFQNPRYIRLAMGLPVPHSAISDFDEIIRQMSLNSGYDWRLIAALIYRESKFKTDARSHVGAFGLMQLMPNTAEQFGADETSTPQEQIAAGLRLIRYLDRALKDRVPDPVERKKFVLAAYNIGLAHILDACNLAEKHNKNPRIWKNNVEYCLLSKSNPEFYNDPVVKYGRVSGKETQQFVSDVLDKYDQYKMIARD